jgi:phospholipid-binding lipoprotein MlaA
MKTEYKIHTIKLFILVITALLLTSCAAAPVAKWPPPVRSEDDYIKPDVEYPLKEVHDPFEGFNRNVYKFNALFDKFVYLPVVNAYVFITPKILRTGVSNVLDNIDEFDNLVNSILQLNIKKTGITAGRVVVNTILGVGGLMDTATAVGLPRQNEDFGQTLGYWGAGNGPFIVLPILGPSNLRDTIGFATDTATFRYVDPLNFDHNDDLEAIYFGLKAVDERYKNKFRYFESGSPFEYELIRLFYTRGRQVLIDN